MRVVIVTGEYPPLIGGIADYTANLVAALHDAGDDVIVLTDQRAAARPTGPGRIVASAGWSFSDLPAVRRQVIGLVPDVVHIEYQTAAFGLGGAINLLPATLGAIPTVVTFHDTREPYLFPKAGMLRRLANARLARDCAAVICTNAEDAETVLAYGAKRAVVIPLGNNVAPSSQPDRQRWRDRLGVSSTDHLVGYFGLISSLKGVETLLEAMSALAGVRLVLIGAGIGDADPTNRVSFGAMQDTIERLGLSRRVTFTGHLAADDVSGCLCACDVVALPYHDGASYRRTTLVAALAHGLPVVTTRPAPTSRAFAPCFGLPPLRDGEELRLVPPEDPGALSAAIWDLLNDPALRLKLGANAQRAAAVFGWPTVARQTRRVYQEAANG